MRLHHLCWFKLEHIDTDFKKHIHLLTEILNLGNYRQVILFLLIEVEMGNNFLWDKDLLEAANH